MILRSSPARGPDLLRLAVLVCCALGGAGMPDAGVRAAQGDAGPGIAFSQEYEQCLAHAVPTAAMRSCVEAEAARWDHRLNAAYQAILGAGEYATQGKAELREAQLAWTAFRDKACAAEGDLFAAGGTAAPLIAGDCALTQTARRALDLERILRSGHPTPSGKP